MDGGAPYEQRHLQLVALTNLKQLSVSSKNLFLHVERYVPLTYQRHRVERPDTTLPPGLETLHLFIGMSTWQVGYTLQWLELLLALKSNGNFTSLKCVRLYFKHTIPLFHFELRNISKQDTPGNFGPILEQISAQSDPGTILTQGSSEVSLLKDFRTNNVDLQLFFLNSQEQHSAARKLVWLGSDEVRLLPKSDIDTNDASNYHRVCHKHAFQASGQNNDLAVCDPASEACSS
jgi:hypothetical protein